MNEKEKLYIHPTVKTVLRVTALVLLLLAVYLTAKIAITFCLGLFAKGNHVVQLPWQDSPIVSLYKPEEKKKPIAPGELAEVARTDILVTGDVLLHMPIVRTAWTGDGYNFDDVFQFLKPYLSGAGFASAYLETTLSGRDRGFSGFPNFNSPDEIASGLKDAGFHALVTSTEHCYDYGTAGLLRTMSTLQGLGIPFLGTVDSAGAPRHSIRTVNGIRIGMTAYTYADQRENGSVGLNGITAESDAAAHINTFDPRRLGRFYTEIEGELTAMRSAGAEVTVVYLHWGDEYSTHVSDTQRAMAQKLCDLGVDVIVGSHPHVVQPMDLLTASNDPSHKTLVIYSTGTLLSNLRSDKADIPTGHSEDGMVVRFTLAKYNDDSVRIVSVGLLPTWVVVHGEGEERDFCILPLDSQIPDWQTAYGLSPNQLSAAKASYNRTMALVTEGLNKVTDYFSARSAGLDPSVGVG